ncbi:MAG TPA: response regulator [Vicinamibacteria bacterium]|nr:response regulator [Vicinamibacteria bacterium]
MSRYRVLLVEPNRDLGGILQEYLRRSDLDVLSAFDAGSALELARRERPDLIVSEAELSGGASGLELSRALATEADLVSVPVLLLSGAVTPEERLDSLSSGAEDYLLKPFTMKELVYRCERLIVHQRKSELGELSGDLARFKSTDVLQLLEANQATGVLHIDGEFKGEIHLLDGYICGCFAESYKGEEAAYRLIPVRNGRFHFVRSNIRSNIQNVRSTTEFMMEALRRHDEKAKLPAS